MLVERHLAFIHDLSKFTEGRRIPDIVNHRVRDDVFRIVAAFDVNLHDLTPSRKFKERSLSQLCTLTHILKLCDRTLLLRFSSSSYPEICATYAIATSIAGYSQTGKDDYLN